MLRCQKSNIGVLITSFVCLSMVSVLSVTEIITDNSILSTSKLPLFSISIALLGTIFWQLLVVKYSLIVSFLDLLFIFSLTTWLFNCRNTIGFFIINESRVQYFINKNFYRWDLIKENSITIFLYEENIEENNLSENIKKNKLSDNNLSDNNKKNILGDNITKNKLNEKMSSSLAYTLKKQLIKKIERQCSSRKLKNSWIVISEDFKGLCCDNKKEMEIFAKMLNSIYYSKFEKNLILILRVFDIKNLEHQGFRRKIQILADNECIDDDDSSKNESDLDKSYKSFSKKTTDEKIDMHEEDNKIHEKDNNMQKEIKNDIHEEIKNDIQDIKDNITVEKNNITVEKDNITVERNNIEDEKNNVKKEKENLQKDGVNENSVETKAIINPFCKSELEQKVEDEKNINICKLVPFNNVTNPEPEITDINLGNMPTDLEIYNIESDQIFAYNILEFLYGVCEFKRDLCGRIINFINVYFTFVYFYIAVYLVQFLLYLYKIASN